MQKTPTYRSSRNALALMAVASAMPVTVTHANAAEVAMSQISGLAQREIIRRQEAVQDADRLLVEGREAFAQQDFQQAVDKYRQALDRLPQAPALADRRQSYTQHLTDASVALAQSHRKVGRYDEARDLLENVLDPSVDPHNAAARVELGYLDDPIRTNPALDYEHVQNVDRVRRGLYMAEGAYNLGKFDQAYTEYQEVLRVDPYNSAARRGMERVSQAKTDYYRAAYDEARATLLAQVDAAWALAVPAEPPTLGVGGETVGAGANVARIQNKLRTIIIPSINFEDTTLDEALDYLRAQARVHDTTETDQNRRGVNIVPRLRQQGPSADAGMDPGGLPALGGGANQYRIRSLQVRNVTLEAALRFVTEPLGLRYRVDEFAVTIVPMTDTGDELFTRQFRVPPDFQSRLGGGGDAGGGDIDPFADTSTRATIAARPPLRDVLEANGVSFSEGASASLTGGTLLVTNTPSELDKIEQLVEAIITAAPRQVKITTKFVEISQENSDELGFDWIVSPFGIGGDLSGAGGTLGNGFPRTGADFVAPLIPGIPFDPAQPVANLVTGGNRSGDGAITRDSIAAILNNPNRTAQSGSVAPGIFGFTGVLGSAEMQMVMRGLSQKKGSDLMTAPSVTARSGQKATIEIIREFIYPTEYEPPELPNSVGATGIGGGGVVDGGFGGGASTFPVTPATPTAFETRNTGVTLEIEPNIDDFMIDLRFAPEIVEFEGFINYGSPIQSAATNTLGQPVTITITENRIEMPVFSSRRVNTALTIYDGYTVAVGGLMREDVQNVEDKVPILGDIPLIGRLFQTKAENRIKSNLIIFVTAEIIDATGQAVRGASGGSVPVSGGMDIGGGGDLLPPLMLPE